MDIMGVSFGEYGNPYISPYTGEPIDRTPVTHPYSFDDYILWTKPGLTRKKAIQGTGSAYSDRLFQWDPAKHDRLCKEHFGDRAQQWGNREPAKIEAFLRDYHDDPSITLTMIVASCNQSSGFPLWAFIWK